MPWQCSICAHDKLSEIDRILRRDGIVVAQLARRFGVSYQALKTHRRRHVRGMRPTVKPKSLQDKIAVLESDVEFLMYEALSGVDIRPALKTIEERRALVELEGKLSGQLESDRGTKVTVNTLVQPQPAQLTAEEAAAVAREYLEVCGPKLELPAGEEGNGDR